MGPPKLSQGRTWRVSQADTRRICRKQLIQFPGKSSCVRATVGYIACDLNNLDVRRIGAYRLHGTNWVFRSRCFSQARHS